MEAGMGVVVAALPGPMPECRGHTGWNLAVCSSTPKNVAYRDKVFWLITQSVIQFLHQTCCLWPRELEKGL